MIRTKCGTCGKTVKAGDDWAGLRGKCPGCGDVIAFASLKQADEFDDFVLTPVDKHTDCPFCGERILARAIKCRHCHEFLDGRPRQEAPPRTIAVNRSLPTMVRFDPQTDTFTGTLPLMVNLAMRAIQQIGWTLDQVNENIGLVTFQTGMSWGSWSGVTCSLSIDGVSPNRFRVSGTGKQNVRGAQLLAPNLFGEAQSKAGKAIDTMKRLAS